MSRPTLLQRIARTQLLLVFGFQLLILTSGSLLVGMPLMQAAARDLAALIMMSAKTWGELPAERRPALVEELAKRRGLQLTLATEPLHSARPWLPYLRTLERDLSGETGSPVTVHAGQDTDYAVDILLHGQRLRFGFDHQRLGADPVSALALMFIGSLLLAMLAARPLARRLTAPLRNLAAGAEQVGRGATPVLPLPEGIEELRHLTETFNTMAAQVQQLLHTRNTLLAGVSHDLRSPLTRLQMALELHREQTPHALAARLDKELAQMNALIGEFLGFAAGVAAEDRAPIPLLAFIRQIARELPQPLAGMTYHGTDEQVTASPTALRRVLENLLLNAARHGDGRVRVETAQRAGQVELTIDDHGPGIPAAERSRVLQPFVRLEASRNRGTGGSGLGLAIVQAICQVNGWALELTDAPTGGLRVRLRIPRTV